MPKQGMLLNSTARTKIFSVVLRFQTNKRKESKRMESSFILRIWYRANIGTRISSTAQTTEKYSPSFYVGDFTLVKNGFDLIIVTLQLDTSYAKCLSIKQVVIACDF